MTIVALVAVSPDLLHAGIISLLREVDQSVTVVSHADGSDLLQEIYTHKPSVVVLDEKALRLNSARFKREFLSSECQFVLVKSSSMAVDLGLNMKIVSVDAAWDDLLKYIGDVIRLAKPDDAESANELTLREKDIIRDIALGLSSKEIADKHNISPHTVITHRKNISRKLGIKSISGLTIYALVNKLASFDELKDI